MSEEQIEEALAEARLRGAIGKLSESELRELAETLVAGLAEGRELPEELGEPLLDAMLGALIAGKRGEREILGSEGVLGQITRRLVERALREELSEHLGYPAGQAPPGGAGNSRNGGTPKTLLTDHGQVEISSWAKLLRRYLPGWVPTDDGITLFNPVTVSVTRYRYRGTKIPNPWNLTTPTACTA